MFEQEIQIQKAIGLLGMSLSQNRRVMIDCLSKSEKLLKEIRELEERCKDMEVKIAGHQESKEINFSLESKPIPQCPTFLSLSLKVE